MSSNLIVFFPMLFLHCFQRHQNPVGFEVLGHFISTFFLSLSFVNPLFQRGPKELRKKRVQRLTASCIVIWT
jgi:hypothetical protein